mgnify:FL=1
MEKAWENGEVTLFDTSILHSAVNPTPSVRYILMLRVWHPELTEAERNGIQFTFDAIDVPGILSESEEERLNARKELEALRKPTRNQPADTSAGKRGFG